jgi:hypothetical protein
MVALVLGGMVWGCMSVLFVEAFEVTPEAWHLMPAICKSAQLTPIDASLAPNSMPLPPRPLLALGIEKFGKPELNRGTYRRKNMVF